MRYSLAKTLAAAHPAARYAGAGPAAHSRAYRYARQLTPATSLRRSGARPPVILQLTESARPSRILATSPLCRPVHAGALQFDFKKKDAIAPRLNIRIQEKQRQDSRELSGKHAGA